MKAIDNNKITENKNDEKKFKEDNIEEDKNKENKNEKELDENINNSCNEKSESIIFPGMIDNNLYNNSQNENMKDILKYNVSNFSNVNPLRDIHNKNKLSKQSIKKKAIMQLVLNLKTQYIVYNIRDFIRKYQINENPNINSKFHKIIRFTRNITLFIYGLIMFFEKPWFCYYKATIPLPSYFNFSKDCENKIAFVGLPFFNHYFIRILELLITLIIIITQLTKYKNEYLLKNTNIGINKSYNIIQIILFISLLLCIIDLIISLATGYFPIMNFILRPFIYIYMVRRIRRNWVRIGKILWRTKTVFFFLFINIILFSLIGFFLFKRENSDYFGGFLQTVLQLYILLSTCNFPDIMLETFQISKWSIFYFIIYISINYFIILSYLKTLYYTKYYNVNKEDCLNIIKYIIENDFNKDIFNGILFKNFILKQKNIYSLTDDEYNNILILLNLYEDNNDLFFGLTKIIEKSPEELMKSDTLGGFLLQSKKLEITINILCFIFLLISSYDNISIFTIQFVWSACLLFELFILIKNLGIKRFFFRHFNRVIFHFFNLVILIGIIYLIILNEKNELQSESYKNGFKILRTFICLRIVRIFVFLDKFRVIKNIYTIIRNSKEMFYRNLNTLYSLFLLFSTFSILLTGGNIEKDSFNDDKINSIPEKYAYINFNDFSSSFISCFCLLMVNNLNILVKSLTHHINNNKIIFQFYFATFYFFSTLILINILQTLLLELYLNSDYSMSGQEKKEKRNDDIDYENEIDRSIDSEKQIKELENYNN